MFLEKINGQEVMFKNGVEALKRLDQQAQDIELPENLNGVMGAKGYSIISTMFAMLGVDESRGESHEIELDVTLLNLYLSKIAFSLQIKKSYEQIVEFIESLEGESYNDFLQNVVDEVRPKAQKTISIK